MARYFPPTLPSPPPAHAQTELLASLERINTFNPPVQTCSTGWRCNGLYAGPTSVAYLFYRLSQLYPTMTFKGQDLVDWASQYLALGMSYLPGNKRASVDASRCGVANETLCQLAIRACMDQDVGLVQALCSDAKFVLGAEGGSDEWLYGRAGYLYLLRLLQSSFSKDQYKAVHELVNQTISLTIDRMLSTPQPWKWYDQVYFGAVHGSIGIITQIMLSSQTPEAHASQLEPILAELLACQLPSGNFPSSLESRSDELVQFCHGSPGFVLCLRAISKGFPSLRPEIETAIEKAQPDLLKRGLLTKAPCLCHGLPTNALALTSNENLEKVLSYMTSIQLEGNKEWMAKAGQSDEFAGLYTGEAGRAWAWAVLDRVKQGEDRWKMGIIGFNDV